MRVATRTRPAATPALHRRRCHRPPPPLLLRRRDGGRSGHAEGRALGLQKGFELGHEVGFYSGCCQLWRQLQARDPQLFGCAGPCSRGRHGCLTATCLRQICVVLMCAAAPLNQPTGTLTWLILPTRPIIWLLRTVLSSCLSAQPSSGQRHRLAGRHGERLPSGRPSGGWSESHCRALLHLKVPAQAAPVCARVPLALVLRAALLCCSTYRCSLVYRTLRDERLHPLMDGMPPPLCLTLAPPNHCSNNPTPGCCPTTWPWAWRTGGSRS